ncbi:alpha/beta hydrolase [Micromonospora sp. NPDC049679]|uniref:alpha/beta fold hydrolase n=1 Tax=Micromonospora sp. NPDC049679 TaxID=3155920 RepID=UPI0033EE92F4
MVAAVRVQGAGSGQRVLLLLHGMGATGDVWAGWRPLLARHWPGRWLAPDLPGHGGSAPLAHYSFDSVAATIAALLNPDDRLVVLGHSFGGVVGLALAGGTRALTVEAVIGLGIKVAWSDRELAKAQALAGRPVTWFASRDEAAGRYLRMSGLAGLLGPDDPTVDAGLREEDGTWRLSLDPAAFGVGAPDMPALLRSVGAPVLLARGEHDPMVTDDQLAELAAPTRTLPGLGHNAHVEDPDAVLRLLDPYR